MAASLNRIDVNSRLEAAIEALQTERRRTADELDEWRKYVETIQDDHYQKYKLRPMLDDLLEEF